MSIFTRREIQRRLNSLAPIIGRKKLTATIGGLNIEGNLTNEKRHLESLAKAWEVVIVSAFADLGNTQYEKRISNGKKPDVFFSEGSVSLIADIVAVSDDQQHKKNPVADFSDIITQLWKDYGPKNGGLSWYVGGVDLEQKDSTPKTPGSWAPIHLTSRLHPINRRPVKRLTLPPGDQLADYLNKTVGPFLRQVRAVPDRPDRLDIDE